MVGLHKEWLQFVDRKQRARQEYHSYKGGDYRVEGRLAVKMAAAQSAERIAQRAMLHRADQLSRGVGLPEEDEKPSAVGMDSVLQPRIHAFPRPPPPSRVNPTANLSI